MIFTTQQACKALLSTPEALRKIRERRGLGHVIVPGRTGWTFADLETVRRLQGRWQSQYRVKFEVSQLKGKRIPGSLSVWADNETMAESKAKAFFWNAEVKEHPEKWGIPVLMEIKTVKAV